MRRIVIAIASTITGLVLLFSWPTSLNRSITLASGAGTAGTGTSSGSSGSSSSSGSASGTPSGTSGTFVGDAVATRYGDVQVQITATDGSITSAEAVAFPDRDGRSQQISAYAIPVLQDETVRANGASIAMVSGATFTSRGYVQSLQSAIDQAGL